MSGDVRRTPDAFLSEEDLARAYRTSVAETEHPGEESWERFAAGELDDREKDSLASHVATCQPCAQVLSAVTELASSARRFDPGVVAESKRRPTWPYTMAAAAALVLVLLRPWQMADDPALVAAGVPAAGGGERALRSTAVIEPQPLQPRGRVAERPNVFVFQRAPGADSHFVRLYDERGALVWASEGTSEERMALPASVVLKSGRYYWQVLGQPQGTQDARDRVISQQADFELAR